MARKGDTVVVYYDGVNFQTEQEEYFRWPPEEPLEKPLAAGSAWELGIEGMRVGGRREIVIPSRLAFNDGAFDFIVDLLAVKPAHAAGIKGGN